MKTETKKHQLTTICRHLFVPHQANYYHPHLVRRTGVAVIVFAVVALQYVSANVFNATAVLGLDSIITPQQLLDDTNQARKQRQLQPLVINKQLTAAAQAKGEDMFSQQYWAHTSPSGATPWDWINKNGYTYTYAGENLAKNYANADATTAAWLASPEHRANVLNDNYTDVGFAVVDGVLHGKKTEIVVAMYAHPASAGVLSAAATLSAAAMSPKFETTQQAEIVLHSIDPAAVASILLLAIFVLVALLAHIHRRKVPVYHQAARRHTHSLLKATGAFSVMVLVVLMYTGGQL